MLRLDFNSSYPTTWSPSELFNSSVQNIPYYGYHNYKAAVKLMETDIFSLHMKSQLAVFYSMLSLYPYVFFLEHNISVTLYSGPNAFPSTTRIDPEIPIAFACPGNLSEKSVY